MKAILLAGGRGTRLYPYTVSLPKPLVPIDDLPIVEIMLRQLRHFGVTEVTVSIGHLSEIITAVLGNGRQYGLKIDYVRESKPLGTAGPLRLMKNLPKNFLVMNGDILTDLNFSRFFKEHLRSSADVSIAAYEKSVPIDLGVMKSRSGRLYQYIEKPTQRFEVSMGIYAMNRAVLDLIPSNRYFDFPSLIQALLRAKRVVRASPFSGEWLDIGRPADYELAQEKFKNKRGRFLRRRRSR